MIKVFLDSSVLMAACVSISGASSFILGYSRQKKIIAYVSFDVIGEARKNVRLKLGSLGIRRLSHFIKFANLLLFPSPTAEEIAESEKYIHVKDAPILAAAKKSQAEFLITLDKKHFMKNEVIQFAKPLVVIIPGNFVRDYLRNL